MKKIFFYKFKICNLSEYIIAENNGSICNVLPQSLLIANCSLLIEKETPLIKRTAKQIEEYLCKKRKSFDLPLKPKGTYFQLKVWKALKHIPYGEIRTYGEIAAAIGKPKASRAVGMANNKNPIHIIIPCHRVIGADGSLTGYAGGLEIKKMLLELEASVSIN